MLNFKDFLIENFLIEAKDSEWGLNKNDAGKMHEVLSGGLINHYAETYQKNKSKGHEAAHKIASESISSPPRKKQGKIEVANISHMAQFKDEDANKSAKEWHEHLSNKLSQEHYNEHLAHAQHAAHSMISHLHSRGITDIKKTHFTANAKDIEKLTGGKDSSSKGNNSDIVIEHGHSHGGGFHGVSLKSGSETKLFNPGAEKNAKIIDALHEKATGKAGTMSKEVKSADNAAVAAHHAAVKEVAPILKKHIGDAALHKAKDGTTHITEHGLDTIRYAQEHLENTAKGRKSRPKVTERLKGMSNERVKSLAGAYQKIQKTKLGSYKTPIAQSLHKHLTNIFSAKGKGAKQAQGDVIRHLTNLPVRESGSMDIMRHNTFTSGKGERKSKTAYGLGDSLKNASSFKVSRNGITTELKGFDKNKNKVVHVNFVADASPTHGSGTGTRKGWHSWNKM
jgi:hypothetical protein